MCQHNVDDQLNQSRALFRIFVEAVIEWQSKLSHATTLVPATLNAIGCCRTFTPNIVSLLESTLYNYFRMRKLQTTNAGAISWTNVAERIGHTLPAIEGTDLVQRHNFLTLHLLTFAKLRALANVGEQLTLLQKLHLILENYNTK